MIYDTQSAQISQKQEEKAVLSLLAVLLLGFITASFIQFNVENFYRSISLTVFENAIQYTKK